MSSLSGPRWMTRFPRLFVFLLGLVLPQPLWAQGVLDNPAFLSVQSGIGLIQGWTCDAEEILVQIDELPPLRAAYGTTRNDTVEVCGDNENGFGLTFNWNLLSDGLHGLQVRVDGVELAKVIFAVTTLGLGEFPQGLVGEGTVQDFPDQGLSVNIEWQESLQNFILKGGSSSSGSGSGGGPPRVLENPQVGSMQSGIGLIQGWVCEAAEVTIGIDELPPLRASYKTSRSDTQVACGDVDNGFGLTFNWNLVENGEHRLRAFADGVQFADVTFTVATLGLGEFPQLETLASSVASVADFPSAGTRVRVQWQDRQQNFIVEGVLQPGEEETVCGTRRGIVTNSAGQEAELECKNPCTRLGETQFCSLVPIQIAPQEQNVSAQKQDEAFLFCAEDLSFEQMEGVFTVGDFQVLDAGGEAIGCREVLPGEELAIAIAVEPMVALSFKEPVRTLFNQSEGVHSRDVTPESVLLQAASSQW